MKEKIKAFFEKHEWLRKSVTIPVKLLLVFVVAILVLVVALAVSKRVEPRVSRILSAEKVVEPLDAVTARILMERMRDHVTLTCTKPAPAPVVKYRAAKPEPKKDVVR